MEIFLKFRAQLLDMKRVLIFSRGPMIYSTQRLKYEAQKQGCHVKIIDHLYCRSVLGSEKANFYYGFESIEGFDVAIPRIGNSVTYMGSMAIRHCEKLKIPVTVSSRGLEIARDKLRCYELMSAEGIPIPKTVYVSPYNEEELMVDDFDNGKMIIKLLQGTQGIGVILAENPKNARSIIETLKKLRKRILVQEFIEESGGSDIRVFVVGGKVVAAMKRQAKEGDFRSNIHRGGMGVPIELSNEEEEIALRVCRTLGLGVAGVDVLRSRRGPLVLEVNPSPGLEGIEQFTKVNVARAIIQYALELSNRDRT